MPSEYRLYLYRCHRCNAVFGLDDREERYGPARREAILKQNPCAACGKGQIEYEGYVIVWR